MVLQDSNKSVQVKAPLNRDLSDRRNITRGRDTSLMSRWTMPQFAKQKKATVQIQGPGGLPYADNIRGGYSL